MRAGQPRPSSWFSILFGWLWSVINIYLFFFCLYWVACGILVSWAGFKPSLLQWKHGVLTTGPPGTVHVVIFILTFILSHLDSGSPFQTGFWILSRHISIILWTFSLLYHATCIRASCIFWQPILELSIFPKCPGLICWSMVFRSHCVSSQCDMFIAVGCYCFHVFSKWTLIYMCVYIFNMYNT